ncbi:MAG: aspartate--ammonia ligase [Candidatus Thermoplasmatota archaeon]
MSQMRSIGGVLIPEGYEPHLNVRETEYAIKFIKDTFECRLARELNLQRVSAPIVVASRTGVNDTLTGVERPVRFLMKATNDHGEIVQSLAKWKRLALADYGFKHGEGLYTDMNAIRPDERLDNLHSIYVDQWDWEMVIAREEKNIPFLKRMVGKIYQVIKEMEKSVCKRYDQMPKAYLPEEIQFIHSEDLEDMYPDLTPSERENAVCEKKGAAFLIGIGAPLRNGCPHDGRAADYDDWITETAQGRRGLNGDILVWYPTLGCAMELSSLGIRVDKESLLTQLKIKNELHKTRLYFHQRLMHEELPMCIGGGIGQSRLCMLFLRKVHIGEVQASIWPDEMAQACLNHNSPLL